jgi:hypothetical protein
MMANTQNEIKAQKFQLISIQIGQMGALYFLVLAFITKDPV